jgi:hypothetical protein
LAALRLLVVLGALHLLAMLGQSFFPGGLAKMPFSAG